MVFDVFGIVIIVVFTVYVFKTANENGRNAIGWAVACLFTGIFVQWVLMLIVFIVIGIVMVLIGARPGSLEDTLGFWVIGIRLGCLALSVVGMFLILKKVSQIPDEEEPFAEPPPPPTFDRAE